jgi:hypothetical protein
MAARIANFVVILVLKGFIFDFPFWLGVFSFSFAKRSASALSPEMRLRLVVGVRILLGGCWMRVVQHERLDVKN